MFAWLRQKKQARARALEIYLSNFDLGELAYLKNITLINLSPDQQWTEDPYVVIDLSTYIHIEWMIASHKILDTPKSKAKARVNYRIKLASVVTKLKTNPSGYSKYTFDHRLDEPDLNMKSQERLCDHWIVLRRLYDDPKNASTLPELEDIGEGRAWLPT